MGGVVGIGTWVAGDHGRAKEKSRSNDDLVWGHDAGGELGRREQTRLNMGVREYGSMEI